MQKNQLLLRRWKRAFSTAYFISKIQKAPSCKMKAPFVAEASKKGRGKMKKFKISCCLLLLTLLLIALTIRRETVAANKGQIIIALVTATPGAGYEINKDLQITDPAAIKEVESIIGGVYIRNIFPDMGHGTRQNQQIWLGYYNGRGHWVQYIISDKGLLTMNGKEYVPLFWSSKKKIYSQLAGYVEQLPEKAAVFLRFCFLIQGTGV